MLHYWAPLILVESTVTGQQAQQWSSEVEAAEAEILEDLDVLVERAFWPCTGKPNKYSILCEDGLYVYTYIYIISILFTPKW